MSCIVMMNVQTYFADLKALQDNITRWITAEWHIQPWLGWKILQYSPSDNIPLGPNPGPRRSDNILRRSNHVPRRWHNVRGGQTWIFGPKNCWIMSFSIVVSTHSRRIPFSCVLSVHITPKANQYSLKYFGTNCCWKISLSQGFSAHVPGATNNIPWSISAPRLAEIFHFHVSLLHMLLRRQSSILRNISAPTAAEIFHLMCINCTYYTEGKPIFSEIFQHQLPPKYFTFTWIQCTCSTSHIQYSLEYFGAESCRNIPFSCVFSAHVTLKAK